MLNSLIGVYDKHSKFSFLSRTLLWREDALQFASMCHNVTVDISNLRDSMPHFNLSRIGSRPATLRQHVTSCFGLHHEHGL